MADFFVARHKNLILASFFTMILLDLRVYWDNTIPVIKVEDMSFLSDFLRHEIIKWNLPMRGT